ncbi:MAG: endonuclease/exonuclease/phosphatase family protein [Pseudomonadota bacterium]
MTVRPAVVLLTTVCLALGSCTALDRASTVSIMTFNVQNLFDTRDDPLKRDETYLPIAAKQSAQHKASCAGIEVAVWRRECLELDWSDVVLDAKLRALADAILANDPSGRGPDILVLQEVENRRVVEALREGYLARADYLPVVLLEGRDARGIDVAFLSRLPLIGKPVLHPAVFPGASDAVVADTRGVLEATFALPDGTPLTGFAVHFPAPFHPVGLRIQAYSMLNQLLAQLPADRLAFAAGDFNTISSEKAVLDEHVVPRWYIGHQMGCGECRGTYYYAPDDNWSFLDMILLSKSFDLSNRWRLKPGSVQVANAHPEQVREDGAPRRFDSANGRGVSDHWPLRIALTN